MKSNGNSFRNPLWNSSLCGRILNAALTFKWYLGSLLVSSMVSQVLLNPLFLQRASAANEVSESTVTVSWELLTNFTDTPDGFEARNLCSRGSRLGTVLQYGPSTDH